MAGARISNRAVSRMSSRQVRLAKRRAAMHRSLTMGQPDQVDLKGLAERMQKLTATRRIPLVDPFSEGDYVTDEVFMATFAGLERARIMIETIHAYAAENPGKPIPFINLTPEELMFVSGRIAFVDLQGMCPWQCLGCALDAAPYRAKEQMPWERVEAFAGIMHFFAERGHPLNALHVFEEGIPNLATPVLLYGGEPTVYSVRDREGNLRTFYDAVKLFAGLHNRPQVLTTAGGPISRLPRGDGIRLVYSIKPFMPMFIRDVDRFLTRFLRDIFETPEDELGTLYSNQAVIGLIRVVRQEFGEKYRADPDGFADDHENISSSSGSWLESLLQLMSTKYDAILFENSKYVKMLKLNLAELIGEDGNGLYSILLNYIEDRHLYGLAARLQKYRFFFSLEFMRRLARHVIPSTTQRFNKLGRHSPFQPHSFIGLGRANRDLGIPRVAEEEIESVQSFKALSDVEKTETYYAKVSVGTVKFDVTRLDLDKLYVMINNRGDIRIFYRTTNFTNLSNPELSREYFERRAEYHEARPDPRGINAETARTYRMLAGLSGKNAFNNDKD